MQKIKKRNILRLGFIAGIILLFGLILHLFLQKKQSVPNMRNQMVEAIKLDCTNQKKLDDDILKVCYQTLVEKESEYNNRSQKKLCAQDYFIMGIYEYRQHQQDASYQHLLLALEQLNKDTDSFVKVAVGYHLFILNPENLQTTIQQMKMIFENLTAQDWNEEIESINTYIMVVLDDSSGRELLIEYLEKAIQNENIHQKTKLYIYDELSIVYATSGNIGKSLEQCLMEIAIAENVEDHFFQIKGKLDISSIYNKMGNYIMAEEYAREYADINYDSKIEDKNQDYFLKAYAIQNLLQALYGQGKYESVVEYKEEIEDLYQYFDESVVAALRTTIALYEATYYLNKGDSKNCKVLLETYEEYKEELPYSIDVNLETLYYTIKGQYYFSIGDYENAELVYKHILNMPKVETLYLKIVLQGLMHISGNRNDFIQALVYGSKLEDIYRKETKDINQQYAEYCVQQYQANKVTIELTQKETAERYRNIVLIILTVVIAFCVIMRLRTLEQLHRIDGLTQCYNRAYFNKVYFKDKSKKNMQLIMYDIDNFKLINDHYGHICGDEVLQNATVVAKKIVGKHGKLFRFGGEEFIVVTYFETEKEAYELAEKIRCAVEKLEWSFHKSVTVSMGIASNEDNYDEILKIVDERMYFSKAKGKNQVTWSENIINDC